MKFKVTIIGLGYVGLPLALEVGKYFDVIGFDIDNDRINQLKKGIDNTKECKRLDFKIANKLKFSDQHEDLRDRNFFIITVPTPVNKRYIPDLKHIIDASILIAKYIKKNSIVVYESTVYPGCLEEVCVPILEKYSGKRMNKDFSLGYSPERINPGKGQKKISEIKKIVSGSNKNALSHIKNFYKKFIKAGIFPTKTIKEAEAAKVIENIQRDLNIALVNELSIIFNKMKIDTKNVIDAASTKWNFMPFYPGLVGGHCIGVDPYYLTFKASKLNYKSKVILAGRTMNNSMPNNVIKILINYYKIKNMKFLNSKILILGLTFKEDCPDTRNSLVFKIINLLKNKTFIDVYDPLVDKDSFNKLISFPKTKNYDSIILAVAHSNFLNLGVKKIRSFGKRKHIFFDLKSAFPIESSDCRL